MSDAHDLSRFVEAQERVYERVTGELGNGRKTSHWIWYIFPQIAGLGFSGMSRKYSIASLDEAKAYLDHPLLGSRLEECVNLVLKTEGRSAKRILGHTDAMKLRSCLTLFAVVDPDNAVFQDTLEKYFDGEPDELTLEILNR